MNIRILTLLALLTASLVTQAADRDSISRPVTGTYAVEIGHTSVLATYLSPLKYTGRNYALSGAWSKAMPFAPEKALMHFDTSVAFSSLLNPMQTANMIGLNGSFGWGMSWRTHIPYGIQLTAGGVVGLTGGLYWLPRNGNNPVQAMANASLGARASLSRPFRIGRLHCLAADVATLPCLGVFFSPEYGETYYEIYLGNHKGLAHAGWWGNNFRIDNLLSLSLDFGRTALTVGYRFKADTQWACNLNTRILTHSLVLGIVPGGLGLKPRRPEAARHIYSTF